METLNAADTAQGCRLQPRRRPYKQAVSAKPARGARHLAAYLSSTVPAGAVPRAHHGCFSDRASQPRNALHTAKGGFGECHEVPWHGSGRALSVPKVQARGVARNIPARLPRQEPRFSEAFPWIFHRKRFWTDLREFFRRTGVSQARLRLHNEPEETLERQTSEPGTAAAWPWACTLNSENLSLRARDKPELEKGHSPEISPGCSDKSREFLARFPGFSARDNFGRF